MIPSFHIETSSSFEADKQNMPSARAIQEIAPISYERRILEEVQLTNIKLDNLCHATSCNKPASTSSQPALEAPSGDVRLPEGHPRDAKKGAEAESKRMSGMIKRVVEATGHGLEELVDVHANPSGKAPAPVWITVSHATRPASRCIVELHRRTYCEVQLCLTFSCCDHSPTQVAVHHSNSPTEDFKVLGIADILASEGGCTHVVAFPAHKHNLSRFVRIVLKNSHGERIHGCHRHEVTALSLQGVPSVRSGISTPHKSVRTRNVVLTSTLRTPSNRSQQSSGSLPRHMSEDTVNGHNYECVAPMCRAGETTHTDQDAERLDENNQLAQAVTRASLLAPIDLSQIRDQRKSITHLISAPSSPCASPASKPAAKSHTSSQRRDPLCIFESNPMIPCIDSVAPAPKASHTLSEADLQAHTASVPDASKKEPKADIPASRAKSQPPAPPPLPPPPVASQPRASPPPPPPLPGTLKNRTPAAPSPPPLPSLNPSNDACSGPLPTKKTVRLFWKKMSSHVDATCAEPSVWSDVAEIPVNIDYSELEEQFAAKATASPGLHSSPQKRVSEAGAPPATILDMDRARNIGVLMRSLRMDVNTILKALYNQLGHRSPAERALEEFELDGILASFPTAAEAEKLKSIRTRKLTSEEHFLKQLEDTPALRQLLGAAKDIQSARAAADTVAVDLAALGKACCSVKRSRTLRKVFRYTLDMGNFLNAGSNNACASAFHVEDLLKLKQVKGSGKAPGCKSLLHFLAKHLIQEQPDSDSRELGKGQDAVATVNVVRGELASCGPASHLDVDSMQQSLASASASVSKISQVLASAAVVEAIPPGVRQAAEAHVKGIGGQLQELATSLAAQMNEFESLLKYLKGVNQHTTPAKLFKVLHSFVTDLEQALMDVLPAHRESPKMPGDSPGPPASAADSHQAKHLVIKELKAFHSRSPAQKRTENIPPLDSGKLRPQRAESADPRPAPVSHRYTGCTESSGSLAMPRDASPRSVVPMPVRTTSISMSRQNPGPLQSGARGDRDSHGGLCPPAGLRRSRSFTGRLRAPEAGSATATAAPPPVLNPPEPAHRSEAQPSLYNLMPSLLRAQSSESQVGRLSGAPSARSHPPNQPEPGPADPRPSDVRTQRKVLSGAAIRRVEPEPYHCAVHAHEPLSSLSRASAHQHISHRPSMNKSGAHLSRGAGAHVRDDYYNAGLIHRNGAPHAGAMQDAVASGDSGMFVPVGSPVYHDPRQPYVFEGDHGLQSIASRRAQYMHATGSPAGLHSPVTPQSYTGSCATPSPQKRMHYGNNFGRPNREVPSAVSDRLSVAHSPISRYDRQGTHTGQSRTNELLARARGVL